jgi:hypothetical protein
MAYERVLAAFPRRPLTLAKSRKPLVAQVMAFLGFLLLAGLGIAALVNYLPPLINDTTISANARPVPGSWGGWNCTIHRAVLADCTIEIHYAAAPAAAPAAPAQAAPAPTQAGTGGKDPQPQPQPRAIAAPGGGGGGQLYRAVPMMFFGTPDRNTPVTVLRDPNDPERIATSLGESYLTDRWITMVVVGGGLIALAIACLFGVISGQRTQRGRRELAAAPNPTIVTLTRVQRVRGAATWTYHWTAGATRFQHKESLAAPATQPQTVDANGALALALTDAGGRVMLITQGLTNLELTDAERNAVLDAINREQPRPAPAPPAAAAPALTR